jgi:hypothetical protein
MTIRSADESVAVENSLDVHEVDLVIDQIRLALFRIPSEIANACEQPLHLFRHSEASPKEDIDTSVSIRGFAMTDSKWLPTHQQLFWWLLGDDFDRTPT